MITKIFEEIQKTQEEALKNLEKIEAILDEIEMNLEEIKYEIPAFIRNQNKEIETEDKEEVKGFDLAVNQIINEKLNK